MGKRIRNEQAFAKAQNRMRIRHQKEVDSVANRIHAIVRKDEIKLTFDSPLQALTYLAERGALKPDEGRHNDIDRQTLVRQALARAVELDFIVVESNGQSLSISPHIEPLSPEAQWQLTTTATKRLDQVLYRAITYTVSSVEERSSISRSGGWGKYGAIRKAPTTQI